jgi:hypothetical protein
MYKYLFLLILAITGCNSGDETSTIAPNGDIYVNAGDDISAQQTVPVTLTGSVSGPGLTTTLWYQLSGTDVDFISTDNPPSITFTTPDIDFPETLVFRLSIIDEFGNIKMDDVNVNIELSPFFTKYSSAVPLPDSAHNWDCVAVNNGFNQLRVFTTFTTDPDAITSIDRVYTFAEIEKDLQALNDSNYCGFNDWAAVSSRTPSIDRDFFKHSKEIWMNEDVRETEARTDLDGVKTFRLKTNTYNIRYTHEIWGAVQL